MRNALLVVLIALAAGCGQKGPLYLRDKPPPGTKPPAEEPYRPKPYPKDAAGENAPSEASKQSTTR
jgi:predicted small lipoprotein YifL